MNISPLGFYYASSFFGKYIYLKTFTKDIKAIIIQKHQAFVGGFLNYSDLVIKDGTGRDRNKSLDAFNSTFQVAKFVADYCAVMGRSCVRMHYTSTLLTEANDFFSTNVNHGRS